MENGRWFRFYTAGRKEACAFMAAQHLTPAFCKSWATERSTSYSSTGYSDGFADLCARCKNPNGESNRFRVLEKSVPQVNDALLTRHSDGAPTEHRMTDTMAPGASSDCTKAYPIASDAPTTSPSHGNTSSVHGESPRPIPENTLRSPHERALAAK